MRQIIEKSYLDWSRDKSPRIQSRGIAALVSMQLKAVSDTSVSVSKSTRCVWPSSVKADSRYLSRRVWMS